jgi:hypothetical protein
MKNGWSKIALLLFCCAAAGFELWHFQTKPISAGQASAVTGKNKPDFVLLPASETIAYSQRFAESGVHVESWEPTVADIDGAETSLSQISALSDNNPGGHIEHPDQYFRQYLAVSIAGKKSIFLNAVCTVQEDNVWRKRLVFVFDGGKCFWHATYDPSTRKFSGLRINGPA